MVPQGGPKGVRRHLPKVSPEAQQYSPALGHWVAKLTAPNLIRYRRVPVPRHNLGHTFVYYPLGCIAEDRLRTQATQGTFEIATFVTLRVQAEGAVDPAHLTVLVASVFPANDQLRSFVCPR